MVHGKRGFVEACYSSFSCLDNTMDGCDVLNKRGFTRPLHAITPYVLLEHTLVTVLIDPGGCVKLLIH